MTECSGLPKNVSFESYDVESVCPSCGGRGLRIFYTVRNIPVHSCLLMTTRQQARSYPKGDLQLGYCRACGFITNTLFSPAAHEYSGAYEETQGFSPCFNSFAGSLAQRIVEKYDIHNKTILEIGCGKGEFLAMMCKLGGNKGIGIDPAYVPMRNPDPSLQMDFIQDFYGPAYSDTHADVVCCRHTLEHIHPVGEFMQSLRQTIGDRLDTLVFFELPDVMRVLGEGAFWDIYYEHCTYFTAGSLARLFRASGIEIDDLYLDFGGQYIIITAYPCSVPTQANRKLEDDLSLTANEVDRFRAICADRMKQWLQTTGEAVRSGNRVVLWGSGSKGVAFLTSLGLDSDIEYVVDINPYRHGKFMPGTGHAIVSPEFLKDYRPDKIVVMNPIYCDEIKKKVEGMGISAEIVPVV
jgi:SAM-dependent methyltransferase